MSRLLANVALSALVLLGPAASVPAAVAEGRDAVWEELHRTNALYIKAHADADAAAVAALYDENGARLSRNGQYARGREAITEAVAAGFDRVGPMKVGIQTLDLWVVDDQAYETGKWSFTYTPPEDERRTIRGRYVTVWKRQADGGWRILADVDVPGN